MTKAVRIALEEELRRQVKAARLARSTFETNFQDSLYAIRRFVESGECGEGECMESFDRGWMFGSFSMEWRHLAGRKRPVLYLPLYLPNPKNGVEVVKPGPALQRDIGVQAKDLVIVVRPDPKSSGVRQAREYAEREHDEYGEYGSWLK